MSRTETPNPIPNPTASQTPPRPDPQPPKAEAPRPDPMFGMPFSPDAFAGYAREHLARLDAWMRELTAMEATMVTRARAAAQQLAQLSQDSLDYVAQLSAEWRKLAVDVTRRASDIVTPRA